MIYLEIGKNYEYNHKYNLAELYYKKVYNYYKSYETSSLLHIINIYYIQNKLIRTKLWLNKLIHLYTYKYKKNILIDNIIDHYNIKLKDFNPLKYMKFKMD